MILRSAPARRPLNPVDWAWGEVPTLGIPGWASDVGFSTGIEVDYHQHAPPRRAGRPSGVCSSRTRTSSVSFTVPCVGIWRMKGFAAFRSSTSGPNRLTAKAPTRVEGVRASMLAAFKTSPSLRAKQTARPMVFNMNQRSAAPPLSAHFARPCSIAPGADVPFECGLKIDRCLHRCRQRFALYIQQTCHLSAITVTTCSTAPNGHYNVDGRPDAVLRSIPLRRTVLKPGRLM